MTTYTARVTRDEDAWKVEVPEVERVTQALNLRQVEEMARDLIAIMTDTEPDSFDLVIEWPEHVAAALEGFRQAGKDAEEAARRATAARQIAAKVLQQEGATVRDIGAMMGVSFQRAQQILESVPKADIAFPAREVAVGLAPWTTAAGDRVPATRLVRQQGVRENIKP